MTIPTTDDHRRQLAGIARRSRAGMTFGDVEVDD